MPRAKFPAGISVMGMQFLSGILDSMTDDVHYYVHHSRGSSDNTGLDANSSFASINSALSVLSTNRHAVIHLLPGHIETIASAAAVNFNKADITVFFHGNGANRAQFLFSSSVAASCGINAAGITFIRPKFVAGIDALTGPIDVNAADFTVYDAEDYDAAGIAITDMIIADANADRLRIFGYKYYESTTGTQKQSRIQVAEADDIHLENIDIVGDFGTGAIENGTAWVDAKLVNINIDNQNTGPVVGILLQGTSSGSMHGVHIRVASGTTYLTAANDMQFFDCKGVGVDADAGEIIGNAMASGVEGKIDTLQAEVSGTAGIVTWKTGAEAANGVSISEALRFVSDAILGTVGLAAFPAGAAAANDVNLAEVIRYIQENICRGGTILPATQSLYDILAGANGIAAFPAAADPANDVSLAEVIRSIFDRQLGDGTDTSVNSLLGKKITKAKSDIFDGTTSTIFTVANGRVLVTQLTGEIEDAALDNSASDTKIQCNPTNGSTKDLCANLDLDSAEQYSLLGITGIPGDAMIKGSSGGVQGMTVKGIIVPEGTIELVSAADIGTGAGTGSFEIWYIPLDDTAVIT